MTNAEIAQHAREIADWVEGAPKEYDGTRWTWVDTEGKKQG